MIQSAEQMQSQLINKSVQDADFRNRLISDPKSTIGQEFGIDIPDNMEIQVHESDLQTVHIALPPQPELTEEQLEAVSAGLCCCGI
ncbi:MAG: NHLP leader peptide family RiPP precursor [Gammaproteobacteria bacterium]|nr:NHLP leader peptide family RiPP precursor [Gammaproteobacteria bacterium]